eukprot:COSAG02_NODE_713_length_18120_cov_27.173409_17_plen_424_part_00
MLLGSPRGSNAYLSREPIASPFTPGAVFGKDDDDDKPSPQSPRGEGDGNVDNVTTTPTPEAAINGNVYAYVEHCSMAFSVEIPLRATLNFNDAASINGRELRVSVPSSWRCRETETEIVPLATIVNIGETHGLTVSLPSRANPLPSLRIEYAGDICYDGIVRGSAHELADWSVGDALETVGSRVMAQLVAALLAERRVVVVCAAPSVRTAVVLASVALVGAEWPHLCLPLLCTTPKNNMTEMILAPVPYVIGLPSLEVLEEETLGELFQVNGDHQICPPCVLMVTTDTEDGCGAASWHRHGSMPPTYSFTFSSAVQRIDDHLAGVLQAASAELLHARDAQDFAHASEATQSLLVAVKQCHGRLQAKCMTVQQSAGMGQKEGSRDRMDDTLASGFMAEYMRSVMWQELARSVSPPTNQEQPQGA